MEELLRQQTGFYKSDVLVSAGHIRSMGFGLNEDIPDCATVPARNLDFSVGKSNTPGAVDVSLSVCAPFRWVSAQFKVKKEG